MPGGYLLLLLFSLIGMALIDFKFKLAVWGERRRSLLTLAIGLVWFLVWDLAGIGLGIFFIGESHWLTGIRLAPQLPVEEPLFLLLLCHTALVTYLALERRK